MSTHLLAIAEELADPIGIVDHGRMLAVGHARPSFAQQVQHDGPLEDLFLKLTGDDIAGRRRGRSRPELAGTRLMSLAIPEPDPTADRRPTPPIRPPAPCAGCAGG